jgi:hypothetical protein
MRKRPESRNSCPTSLQPEESTSGVSAPAVPVPVPVPVPEWNDQYFHAQENRR